MGTKPKKMRSWASWRTNPSLNAHQATAPTTTTEAMRTRPRVRHRLSAPNVAITRTATSAYHHSSVRPISSCRAPA